MENKHSKLASPSFAPTIAIFLYTFSLIFIVADAYDPLDPTGNITIKGDVMSFTDDGYVATIHLYNYQKYRHIQAPGWALGWHWAQEEVIWSMLGAQATMQGDCSKFGQTIPHCCKRDPTIVDLLPGVPYNNQFSNCCKGGVLPSWVQDPPNAVAAFQLTVGRAKVDQNHQVKLPQNFTVMSPGPGYTCSPARVVNPTLFPSPDGRRKTQAFMTWEVTCTYSQFMAQKGPTCCVSLSSFYNETIVPCPTCTCSCPNNTAGGCFTSTPALQQFPASASKVAGLLPLPVTPELQCTPDMCPVRIHWHVKQNYKLYWRVKVTITNHNYAWNYSNWNLVVQHPNFNNLTQVYSFAYSDLAPYGAINDTAMFWGVKYYNDLLLHAGADGNVQSELLFQKDAETFSLKQGWAFPRRVLFNGDVCVLPPPDAYPWLPNGSIKSIPMSNLSKAFIWLLPFLISALLLH